MKVGIVGGSIAGCTAAIEFLRAGHSVTIYERSDAPLQGRGVGIGTPTSTLRTLVARDLVGGDLPRVVVSRQAFMGRTTAEEQLGRTPLTLPLEMALCHWGDLFRELRTRVPDETYRSGEGVGAVSLDGSNAVVLHLEDGTEDRSDLVLFADGSQSVGRHTLFPGLEPEYRGYVLWRGCLEERQLADSEPLEKAFVRLHYKGMPGNAVFTFAPGRCGSVKPRSRWVNWTCTIPLPESDRSDFLVDKEGRQHAAFVPSGWMRPEAEARLRGLVNEHLPPYFGAIIMASRGTFVQPVTTVQVPAYVSGRCALLGDAGSVTPPFTGSGVFKATQNAIDLAMALRSATDVDGALRAWSEEQAEAGRRLAALGQQMEDAFIWNAPNFSTMDAARAQRWWTSAISLPEACSYREAEAS
jgi:2-polyprenyl-6-methoxyphenol hydroxylase-like FAD-dependent oxidoreductase